MKKKNRTNVSPRLGMLSTCCAHSLSVSGSHRAAMHHNMSRSPYLDLLARYICYFIRKYTAKSWLYPRDASQHKCQRYAEIALVRYVYWELGINFVMSWKHLAAESEDRWASRDYVLINLGKAKRILEKQTHAVSYDKCQKYK